MAELEQPLGSSEVLQAVLAEVGEAGAVGDPTVQERARRLGHEHLTSVRGVRDSSSLVDGDRGVVPSDRCGLTGVQPHPDADLGPSGHRSRTCAT